MNRHRSAGLVLVERSDQARLEPCTQGGRDHFRPSIVRVSNLFPRFFLFPPALLFMNRNGPISIKPAPWLRERNCSWMPSFLALVTELRTRRASSASNN